MNTATQHGSWASDQVQRWRTWWKCRVFAASWPAWAVSSIAPSHAQPHSTQTRFTRAHAWERCDCCVSPEVGQRRQPATTEAYAGARTAMWVPTFRTVGLRTLPLLIWL